MGNFPGGSAYAMARDIGEGYQTVNERTFQRFNRADLDKLSFEMNRLIKEVRGDQPAIDDLPAVQQRNRKIQRLNTAMMILRAFRMKRKI
jgi:hypothetical protein